MNTITKLFKKLKFDLFFSWLWEQKLVLLISLVLISPYLFRYLPPQASWFIWQRRIATAGLMLHSVPLVLHDLIGSYLFRQSEALALFFYPPGLFFIHLLIWDFAVLYLIKRMWQMRAMGNNGVFAILTLIGISYSLLSGLLILFGSYMVGPIHSSCEIYTSEMDGIRIVAFPEKKLLGNDHLFYLKTSDRGQTWEQAGYEIEGNPHSIEDEDCLEYLQENP